MENQHLKKTFYEGMAKLSYHRSWFLSFYFVVSTYLYDDNEEVVVNVTNYFISQFEMSVVWFNGELVL